MNVYDAAALSAVVDLSVRSVAKRSRPLDVPGFHARPLEDEPAARHRRAQSNAYGQRHHT